MESLCLTCTKNTAKKPLLVNQFGPTLSHKEWACARWPRGRRGTERPARRARGWTTAPRASTSGATWRARRWTSPRCTCVGPHEALLGPLWLCRPQSARGSAHLLHAVTFSSSCDRASSCARPACWRLSTLLKLSLSHAALRAGSYSRPVLRRHSTKPKLHLSTHAAALATALSTIVTRQLAS